MKKKVLSMFLACIFCLCGLGMLAGCGELPTGSFYDLDEAYEMGFLTQNDLKNIAYYYHTRNGDTEHVDPTFTPSPKNPETLDEKTQRAIKQDYLNKVIDMPDGSIDHVFIYYYYGTYNGNIVIHVTDDYYCYDYLFEDVNIGGVNFYSYTAAYLQVWHVAETA